MKRYSQMGTAMIPGCTSLDGKPAGQWVEWKDVEVLLAELNLLRSSVPTEEVRNAIIEEIAGHTTMRSFANGEFNWCITDYDIRALKTPVSPQQEKP